jgi:predicted glycogen debranching enzyme
VLTLQKSRDTEIISTSLADQNIESLLAKEWLLTNQRGGYSSSSVSACNTRRYHGLLVGSLNPPVNRIMALSHCLETLIVNGETIDLSTCRFEDKFAPQGFKAIKQFRKDIGVHFDYRIDGIELTKSVYLLGDEDTGAIVYDFGRTRQKADLILRPFVGLRDFHTLQKSHAPLCSKETENDLLVYQNVPGGCELSMTCQGGNFERDRQWWFNFVYLIDKRRGQDFTEDLWTPGFFRCQVTSRSKFILWANFAGQGRSKQLNDYNIKKVCADLRDHQNALISAAKAKDKIQKTLCLAADDFIVTREQQLQSTSILAGFPWFADWGRDAFISLPGLLLQTGRFEQARSVLTTFASAVDQGMVPNRFDDRSDTAHFNSVDSSLWFINAAFQYLKVTGDTETFDKHLLGKICQIVDSYEKGTRFGIHADSDGLITAGDEQSQLTWMDAKYDGVAFTPRYGKTVEINALWYNSLCLLAQYFTDHDTDAADRYHSMADKVETSFRQLFWNQANGFLNDCIIPNGSVDSSLRPNQIFAVSLEFSPLTKQQRKAVVGWVEKNLLTPFGLRTLDAFDTRYKGRYHGSQKDRDEAYHQGTVWPYLMGHFVEAYLKVNDFSDEAKQKATKFIAPLLRHLTENSCLGSVSEIFDGDTPQSSKGCPAQAWSVAELIRAVHFLD